jgi:restriction endonuclease S subunit
VKAGWETKSLGEVCAFINRGVSPKYIDQGGIRVLNQKCVRDHRVIYDLARRHDANAKAISKERLVQKGDVLVNSTGTGTLGRVAQLREKPDEPTTVDSHLTIVRPKPAIFELDFFGYMLIVIEDAIKEAGEGCGGQTELARAVLADRFSVSYPISRTEQRRIVGILDEAFAGLDVLRANAEKNLENARALFDSRLDAVFTQRGEGWVETTIVIGRKGTLGKVFYLESDFWPHDTTLWVKKFNGNNPRFVYYFFTGLDTAQLDSGAANPALNRNYVHPIQIRWPPVASQITIAEQLDALSTETQRLAALYQQKLAALAELKQSILQKAFAGELTMEASPVVVAPMSAGMAVDSKQATAMVLALAYERHKRQNREKTFGHVKAQKILHMVEAEAEFDLGRQPIRDAAGPNDFPHMLAAKDWAEANRYFRFPKTKERGSQFEPLAHFAELAKAAHGIEPSIRTKIETIIDLLIPMDTQKAEVFATVYAAWNNLLIESRKPTDDEIIRTAREDWHPDKLDIPRAKFVEALQLLKDKNCKPTGRGRFVPPPLQARLPL